MTIVMFVSENGLYFRGNHITMQPMIMNALLQDREEAGHQLGKMLWAYKHSNAVVVGIPHGGVCVAAAVAESLSLPLEVIPCRKIKHPANGKITIGSVSEHDVFIHDDAHTIPQDYIYHQILLLKNAISYDMRKYYGSRKPQSVHYRPVILVDDILSCSDTVIACLRGIKKQSPLKVIVAVPIVAAEAARIVSAEADDLKFLRMEPSLESAHEYFADFPKVDDNKVKALLDASRKSFHVYG